MDLLIYFPTFLDMESGPESLSTLFMPKGPGNHFTDPIGLIKKLIRLGADVNFTPEPVNKIVSTFSALAMVKRWQVNFISHQQQQDTISFLEGIGAKEIIRQGN
jgi:hypothetical protein